METTLSHTVTRIITIKTVIKLSKQTGGFKIRKKGVYISLTMSICYQ